MSVFNEPIPVPNFPNFVPPSVPEMAFNALRQRILAFQKTLDESEAVGARLASFGQAVTIQIHKMSLSGQLVCFEGITGDGDEATLVQHYSQLSVLLIKVRVQKPEQKRPIGFTNGE